MDGWILTSCMYKHVQTTCQRNTHQQTPSSPALRPAYSQALSSVELSEEVPELDSDVLTVGYPLGGENICVTRGVAAW